MSSKVQDLAGLSRPELEAFATSLGEPAFRGRQLFRWIFGRLETDFDRMTDLPAAFRRRLPEVARIAVPNEAGRQTASDGTIKFLFALDSGRLVESVLIPDFEEDGRANRLTVCVSSQVGCAMACSFCATGQMGFHQNLHAGEIYFQVALLNRVAVERFGRPVTNVVYMGMGEPLQNYAAVLRSVGLLSDPEALGMAARRITVSTVGLAARIRRLADDGFAGNLAVSLHAPDDGKRSDIMPVNRGARTDLAALRDAIRYYARKTGRGVTYEYCMFRGFNDMDEDARRLAAVVGWAPSKVNLIMYNPVPGLGFERSDESRLNAFIRILVERDVVVTVRRSRGQDIDAACGQLATRETG
jgi:23S rRNA (adenine2503-C2)-methyltransferase